MSIVRRVEKKKIDSCAPVVVLGMHKSGTSLVAEILHRSGIQMFEKDTGVGYDDGNKMERDECRTLNIELLKSGDKHSVQTVAPLELRTVTPKQWQIGRDIVARCAEENCQWGFKDPRTVLTLPYWLRVAPNSRLIGVFRDPVEVFQHYNEKPWPARFRGNRYYPIMTLYAWCVYNKHLLQAAKTQDGMLLLDYGALMTSDEGLERLSDFLGQPVEDCRRKKMRRSSPERTKTYGFVRMFVLLRYGLDADRIFGALQRARHVLK